MKKMIVLICAVMTIVSCQKEKMSAVGPQKTMQEQVADLIKKSDPATYDVIYGDNKAMKPSVHTHPGVFHWPATGDPQDGYCISWPNCVCMICIEGAKFVDENTPEDEITRDFHMTWANPGDAELIINDGNGTLIQNLKTLDVTFDQNRNSCFNYSTL